MPAALHSHTTLPAVVKAAKDGREKAKTLHRLVEPFTIGGMTLDNLLIATALRLMETDERAAVEMVQRLMPQVDEVELRIQLRKAQQKH